jgi:hypothetical protein
MSKKVGFSQKAFAQACGQRFDKVFDTKSGSTSGNISVNMSGSVSESVSENVLRNIEGSARHKVFGKTPAQDGGQEAMDRASWRSLGALALAGVLLKGCLGGLSDGGDVETVQVVRPSGFGGFTVTSYTTKRRKVRSTIVQVQSSLTGLQLSLAVRSRLRDDWGLEPWEAQSRWNQLLASRNFRLHLGAKLMDVEEDLWSEIITHEALVWFVSSVGAPSYVSGGVRVPHGPSSYEQRRLTRAMARLAEAVADGMPDVVDLSARHRAVRSIHKQPETFYTRVKSVQNITGTSWQTAKAHTKSMQNAMAAPTPAAAPSSYAPVRAWRKNRTGTIHTVTPHTHTKNVSHLSTARPKNVQPTAWTSTAANKNTAHTPAPTYGNTAASALSQLASRRKNKRRNTDRDSSLSHAAAVSKNTYSAPVRVATAMKNTRAAHTAPRSSVTALATHRAYAAQRTDSHRVSTQNGSIKNAYLRPLRPASCEVLPTSAEEARTRTTTTRRKNKRRNDDDTLTLAPATAGGKNALGDGTLATLPTTPTNVASASRHRQAAYRSSAKANGALTSPARITGKNS